MAKINIFVSRMQVESCKQIHSGEESGQSTKVDVGTFVNVRTGVVVESHHQIIILTSLELKKSFCEVSL